jgi:hypothetical protein
MDYQEKRRGEERRLTTTKVLQLFCFTLSKRNDLFGEVCQFSHMNTETLITNSLFDLVEKGDIILFRYDPFSRARRDLCADVKVLDVGQSLVEDREFVEMGCKEAETSDLGCDVSIS